MQATTADDGYQSFLAKINQRFLLNIEGHSNLFTTNASGLWELYLNFFPTDVRQHYNCNACRKFIEKYGALVTVDDRGNTRSAMWNVTDAPPLFADAVRAIMGTVETAKVTGVFLSKEPSWGTPTTGEFNHFAVAPPRDFVLEKLTQTAGQARAEKLEDFKTVLRALKEFSLDTLDQVVTLLKSDALYRSEKVLGPAEWLRDLRRNCAHKNLVWRAVAAAPAGFCHPRSSMVGTLLADIASGDFNFEEASARFAAKMGPLQYQRPQALPSAGNVAQAEKIIEQMGIKAALSRRFARLEDLDTLWLPATPTPAETDNSDGVFGHLKTKGGQGHTLDLGEVPPQVMTLDKFRRTILPDALAIELNIRSGAHPLAALVTAADPDAPLILQWDNPVSWYLYGGGSSAYQWGLDPGWCKVNALTLKPPMWSGKPHNQGDGLFFILDKARDSNNTTVGLFPEILKSELHPIRSTIEAFSRSRKLEGEDEATACGMAFFKGSAQPVTLKVRTAEATLIYTLDRWD